MCSSILHYTLDLISKYGETIKKGKLCMTAYCMYE